MSSDFWKDYEPEPTRPALMTKDEALDLALEALEPMQNSRDDTAIERAITAIKQARSAPVQEPVQASQIQSDVQEALFEATYLAGLPLAPLVAIEGNAGRYVIDALTPPAAQRQWVGLTDEEIDKHLSEDAQGDCEMHEFARAIEAKLKEKNT